MKNLIIAVLAIYGFYVEAAPERKPVVSPKQKFNLVEISGYNDIYQDLQAGVDSQYLGWSIFENVTDHSEVPVQMEKLSFCKHAANAKPVTSAEVAQLIRNDVATMALHLQSYEVDQAELESVVSQYDRMTADFEHLFATAYLTVCEEETVPAYTDGQRNTVVRFNNRVLLLLQLTKPD